MDDSQSLTEPFVSTIAGGGGYVHEGGKDGIGASASFYSPSGLAIDNDGNIYVADTNNHKIRKITPEGVVSTIAGQQSFGSTNGNGTSASFFFPEGLTVDEKGNIYVADTQNSQIRKITPAGMVSTFLHSATIYGTRLYNPRAVVISKDETVYVANSGQESIIKVTPSGGESPFARNSSTPMGMSIDKNGNIYAAEADSNKIRKITPAGVVSTLAGSGSYGSTDGESASASFKSPHGVAVDQDGNVFVADTYNNKIRKITPEGVVSTIAGQQSSGATDGNSTTALFSSPKGIAVDKEGNLYIADTTSNKIRKIIQPHSKLQGTINTSGNYSFTLLVNDGATTTEQTYSLTVLEANDAPIFSSISDVTLTESNKNPTIPFTVEDEETSASELSITASSSDESVIPLSNIILGGSGSNITLTLSPSNKNGQSNITLTLSDGIKSTSLTFKVNVKVNTTANAQIGKNTYYSLTIPHFNNATTVSLKSGFILPFGLTLQSLMQPLVSTLAGSGSYGSTDGIGAVASFYYPSGVAVDKDGTVYVADSRNNKIRKITPNGVVSTFAGSGISGSSDGNGTAASFNSPEEIAADVSGNIYVADTYNNKIRKITPNGVVSTFAGQQNFGGADGNGTSASFAGLVV